MINRAASNAKNKAKNLTNRSLQRLANYHDSIPVTEIDGILVENGFQATEPAIYCGREGNCICPVGDGVYLSLSWHKMDVTGRYEIVAYVS